MRACCRSAAVVAMATRCPQRPGKHLVDGAQACGSAGPRHILHRCQEGGCVHGRGQGRGAAGNQGEGCEDWLAGRALAGSSSPLSTLNWYVATSTAPSLKTSNTAPLAYHPAKM